MNQFTNKIKNSYLFYEGLLLLASIIWGLAFVAQRIGMEYIGPFLFNGIRFLLGVLTLLPFIFIKNKNKINHKSQFNFENNYNKKKFYNKNESNRKFENKIIDAGENELTNRKLSFKFLIPGIVAGIILFVASSLQQIGIIYTTAGKAGFITGLYVVIVPIYGIFLKQKNSLFSWIGAILSTFGLYLLSVRSNFTINKGDFLIFIGAFVWAMHVQYISHQSKKTDTFIFSITQFFVTSLLSIITAFIFEKIEIKSILNASIPIIYGGIFSVGIAYTLQVYGQKKAHPTHAAILLSAESLFAVIGGYFILHELLSLKELSGCLLMFIAIIISQIRKN